MKLFPPDNFISGKEEWLGIDFVSTTPNWVQNNVKPDVRYYNPISLPCSNTILILTPDNLLLPNCSSRKKKIDLISVFWKKYFDKNTSWVIISGPVALSRNWLKFFKKCDIYFSISKLNPHLLESRLIGLIREKWDGIKMMHASLISFKNKGILLTGDAGCGKTCCALELVKRGCDWIADDMVILKKQADNTIKGYGPKEIRGLFHQRETGIQYVSESIKNISLKEDADIEIIMELEMSDSESFKKKTSLDTQEIMGVIIPYKKVDYHDSIIDKTMKIMNIIHAMG